MRATRQEALPGRSERPSRVPINGERDILGVTGIPPEYHPCWVNDVSNNIQKYLDAGYLFWTGAVAVGDKKVDSDSPMSSGVISKNVGNDLTAYLMVVPMEYYLEDQAKIQVQVSEMESTMLRNTKQGEGRYGKVKVEHALVDQSE